MDVKTLPRREREKLRQREDLLAAALELFSESGYHNVSMREIAQRAEFAVGTVYKFFRNKEDLYKALIMATAAEYHRVLKAALDEQKEVPSVLRDYVAAKAAVVVGGAPTLRLYFAETRGASFNIKAGLDQDIRKLYDEVVAQLASVFASGVKKKVFRKLDPYYMAVALEGMTNAFLFCWLENPKRHSYETNIPTVMDMFMEGVLVK
ncbi:MAG: TetR/AcrR family transcriptional regulator [Thermoanaerobaculia bacterium]|nr:TetR/AcrR family transcriptional regulator [Thermoanaerobaculia bacterium]